MTFRIVRFSTGETFAAFIEHAEAIAAARDLARLHREPFAVHAALQYDTEVMAYINGRPRLVKP
jgi:hypothetical protein